MNEDGYFVFGQNNIRTDTQGFVVQVSSSIAKNLSHQKMNLPDRESAIIEQDKLVNYLLNGAHPDNGGKAAFFQSLGFNRENWSALAEALRKLTEANEVAECLESSHGTKYILDGWIESSERAKVRTVWIIDKGQSSPRLVTAYPGKR
jgi:hypothetical protein